MKVLQFFAVMLFFFPSAKASVQERAYSYLLRDITVSYRIPPELAAAYTRVRGQFESYNDRVIYTTSFTVRKLLTEKSVGNFTMAVIAMPDELRGDHSMAKLGEYFKTGAEPGSETATASTYASDRGEWLKIERCPIADTSKVSGVLFYRVISDRDILFVGLGTQPNDSWPPSLLKKLLPAVKKVVGSIEYTSTDKAAKPAK